MAPAIATPTWTGFYVGGNVGYSWGNWDATGQLVDLGGQHNFDVNGIIGGLQAGFNWQFNQNWLIGVEVDFQWSAEKDDFSWVFPISIGDSLSGFTIKNEMKFPWFATVRGRVGYVPDPNWLVYLTGGLAVGRVEESATASFNGASVTISDKDTKTGWTLGGGVEAKLGNNSHWSAKIEYLYIDLGTVNMLTNTVAIDVRDHIARAGINYRF
jgi:outer membrane immunogenic protein